MVNFRISLVLHDQARYNLQTHARTYSPDSGEFVYFSVNSSVYCQKRGVAFGKALPIIMLIVSVRAALDPRKLTRASEQLREVGRRLAGGVLST